MSEISYIEVLGSLMAYRRSGSRDKPTVLFLHGNPTSSYIWRDIMCRVDDADCVAPDLIGFGHSGKPDIEYRFADHVRYLDAFIEAMGLTSFYLVAQDWGTALAFELAARAPQRVRGLAFMEFIRPFATWDDFHQRPAARELFQQFRTPGTGERLIIDENFFIERVLQGSVHRKLTDEEMDQYRQPFLDKEARLPVWRLPNELPIAGEPNDVWDVLTKAHEALRQSRYPKILFYGSPGALVSPDFATAFAVGLTDCKPVSLGPGAHYLQEDHPEAIAAGITELLARAADPQPWIVSRADISITYCGPCGYLEKAQAAAAELEKELGITPTLIKGAGGVYRVCSGDEVVVSRRKGYFPSSEDVVAAVAGAINRPVKKQMGSLASMEAAS